MSKNNNKYTKKNVTNYVYENNYDSELPTAPNLEIYKGTFGDIINITDEWYKNNEE